MRAYPQFPAQRVVKTRGVVMKTKFMLALSAGLLLATTSAFAFQEDQPATPAPGQAAPAAGVNTPDDGVGKPANSGTEVTIPGLGKLGTLPKMDFGLELLYGAKENKPIEVEPTNPAQTPEADDLTIRGTMKHSF